jgi:CRP-like cAMP-binding protein
MGGTCLINTDLTHKNLFGKCFSVRLFSLKKGEALFRQGEAVTRFYVVDEGRIHLKRNSMDGCPALLQVALAGEMVAEASLFSGTYHCTAIADCLSSGYSVRKQALMEYLTSSPQAAVQVMEILAQQIRDLRALHEIRNIRSAKERAMNYLRLLSDDQAQVQLHISLKDMAYRLGLSHEAFYRALKQLEDDNMICRGDQLIQLL